MRRFLKYNLRELILFFITPLLSLVSLSCGKGNGRGNQNEPDRIQGSDMEMVQNNLEDKKGELYMLVEGAVDSWFLYHLHDYRSYEPIIRSTDYNAEEDFYIHKCRYRASTLEGGYETEEKIFKVILQVDSTGIKDFSVEDLTGYKSPTEKDD